jgi:hypothetical protein
VQSSVADSPSKHLQPVGVDGSEQVLASLDVHVALMLLLPLLPLACADCVTSCNYSCRRCCCCYIVSKGPAVV